MRGGHAYISLSVIRKRNETMQSHKENNTPIQRVTMADPQLPAGLGRINYNAYCSTRNWLSFDGKALPQWEDVKPEIREGWECGASTGLKCLPGLHAAIVAENEALKKQISELQAEIEDLIREQH